MRRVRTDQLRPGMKVARTIYASDGRILLNAGVELKDSYIKHLLRIGVPAAFIEDSEAPNVEPPDLISDKTRLQGIIAVKEVMVQVREQMEQDLSGRRRPFVIDASKVLSTVRSLVDEVIRSRNVVASLNEVRTLDDYTFGHCVNVAVLSVATGLDLGYDVGRLRDLAIGAMLHDIGKTKIPREILQKPGELNQAELALVRRHTEMGFEVLKKMPEISLLSAHVALQHHERWGGDGYPRGLKGMEIHEYARIVAVVDVFDAMVSDRIYRKAHPTIEVLEMISASGDFQFDHRIISAFLRNVAPYPVGSHVRLNTGERGVVVHVTKGLAQRPKVRIVAHPSGQPVAKPYEVDLASNHSLFIAKLLDESEIQNPASVLAKATVGGPSR